MNSGVYVLRFPSGKFYIGKAEDTAARFKQHISKLEKGTAASNMQREYNTSGPPILEKVFKIHADHVDLIESILIAQYKHHDECLNATQPRKVSQEDAQTLGIHIGSLEYSTAEHLRLLTNFQIRYKKYKKRYKDLRKGGIVLPKETEDEINTLKSQNTNQYNLINNMRTHNESLQSTVDKYKNMSLLKRIFNYNV